MADQTARKRSLAIDFFREPGRPRLEVITDLGEVRVFEVVLPPNCELGLHAHRYARFGFMLEGAANEQMLDSELLLNTDSFSWHPAELAHTNRTGSQEARMLLIELSHLAARELVPTVVELRVPSVRTLPGLRRAALALSRELRAPDRARSAAVEGLTLDFLARASASLDRQMSACREPAAPPQWLEQMKLMIDLHLDKRLSLQRLAGDVGVSQNDVTRAFKQHLDATFDSYLRRQRLLRALTLLRDTGQSIADIALLSGFYDQSHLGHTMRRELGLTPTKYRAVHKS